MNKLLRADFARLFRNKLFIVFAGFMALYPLFLIYTSYHDMQSTGFVTMFEENLWSSGEFAAILMAIFVPLFIGTEYNDKTIRNKVIIGHSKAKIFMSNMITMMTACVILLTVWNALFFGAGIWFLPLANPVMLDLLLCVRTYIACLVLTAILVCISMFITSKAGAAVTCIMLCFGLLLAGVLIKTKLEQPEQISALEYELGVDVTLLGDAGVISEPKMVANPNYVPDGPQRRALTVVMNALVGSQIIDCSSGHDIPVIWYAVFDNIALVLICVIGATFFNKKEIS